MNGKDYFGFGLIIVSLALFLFPNPILLIDDSHYLYPIAFNDSNNTLVNISFDFNRNSISREYEISNGEKVYLNYVNIYIDDFSDNTSLNTLPTFMLNKNIYTPITRMYEYSLQLESETLNDSTQYLTIIKPANYTISNIEVSYYGSNYQYYTLYEDILWIIIIIMTLSGLAILVI